jgi:hypothetical protein
MPTTDSWTQTPSHPRLPGWCLGLLPIIKLANGNSTHSPVDVSRESAPAIARAVYTAIERAPSKMLIGIDLQEISLMPSFLWRQLGPLLHGQVIEGALGLDKRIVYLTRGDEEAIRNLQWAFLDSSREAFTRTSKLMDRAAIVPAAPKGYCGVLRLPYEEVFILINRQGALSNEELVELVNRRYSLNNANNYLTALADLGLVYRQIVPRDTGGYASRTYALSVPEEVMNNAIQLI